MSRGVHVKRLIIAVVSLAALSASTLVVSPSAFADTKSKSVKSAKIPSIKCSSTRAVGHAPQSVAQADKPFKRLPKTFTFVTNCGNIVVTTVGSRAPITITQLATLARSGYFNNSLCHRLTTQGSFVLQCGDPTATGTGGPNFTYRDENLPDQKGVNYPAGTVAMLNSGPGVNGEGTNGSQFFFVFADTTLLPRYTIWGNVTQGLDIVRAIAKAGVKGGGADGAPNQPISINRVMVSNN
jgi:peptidyl-prolyl cis-trans isomerase B (cyclophilin B)